MFWTSGWARKCSTRVRKAAASSSVRVRSSSAGVSGMSASPSGVGGRAASGRRVQADADEGFLDQPVDHGDRRLALVGALGAGLCVDRELAVGAGAALDDVARAQELV